MIEALDWMLRALGFAVVMSMVGLILFLVTVAFTDSLRAKRSKIGDNLLVIAALWQQRAEALLAQDVNDKVAQELIGCAIDVRMALFDDPLYGDKAAKALNP